MIQDYLPSPFRIKIKLSKRAEEGYESDLVLISSLVSTIQVLGRVATIGQIYKDKVAWVACIKERAKAKDVFDLWYISQKLKIPFTPQEMPKKELVRDLRKYLPKDFWGIINGLTG